MQIFANTPEEYIALIPSDRREAISNLRREILLNLPSGFEEVMCYGMIGYVVPHSVYPAGYHVDPKIPLPFISLASQKNFIAVYHMGLYSDKELLNWFIHEYKSQSMTKLDMGKSCIRLKKISEIPYKLIGELASRMSVQDWIRIYESQIKR